MNVRELMDKRAGLVGQARALVNVAEKDGVEMSAEDNAQFDALMKEADDLDMKIERSRRLETAEAGLQLGQRQSNGGAVGAGLRLGGDAEQRARDEMHATAAFVRSGDLGPLMDLRATSNDTDMNITTAADGGVLVPTGHYNGIIAKRNEGALYIPLGVMNVPGLGTTVNVPYESGEANVFVATDEATTDNDRDAPALDKIQMTLVDFTKDIELTNDLMVDEDSNLMTFLNDYVGRALARTHNSALLTAVLAGGTSVALTAAAAASAGDPEKIIYAMQGEYADNANWVMKRATEGKFRVLTGNLFLYQPTPNGVTRSLGGFPVFNSEYAAAVGSGNKSVVFANFNYVGMRQGQLNFLRNPYLKAKKRTLVLHYYARIVYKVLNADAVLYGQHPTA